MFSEILYVYIQGVNKCLSIIMEFDNVVVVQEISIFHLFVICLNVALQDLGPIGQNYLFFVDVFDLMRFVSIVLVISTNDIIEFIVC